jgi:hypothetical protein
MPQHKSRARLGALVVLGFAATAAFVPTAAHAAPVPGNCFGFNADTGTITSYTPSASCGLDVTIPAAIGGVPVTGIGWAALADDELTAVEIPASVETVGDFAFANNRLTAISFPDTIQNLGDSVVDDNPVLEEISFGTADYTGPARWDLLRYDAESDLGNTGIGGLKRVYFGNVVRSIEIFGFARNGLTSVTIPSSVTEVGVGAFQENLLTSVRIEAGVETIRDRAFMMNDLADVYIAGNPALGENVFSENISEQTFTNVLGPDATGDEEYEYIRENAKLVQVHATDPAFLASHRGQVQLETYDAFAGDDAWGFIVNAAQVEVSHFDNATSEQIAPNTIRTGDGPVDYRVASAREFGADAFYFLGDSPAVAADDIDGYITPDPVLMTLVSSNNALAIGYDRVAGGDSGTPGTGDGVPGGVGADPDAGAGSGTDSGAGNDGAQNATGDTVSADGTTVATGGFDTMALTIGALLTMVLGAAGFLVWRRLNHATA